MKVYPLLKANSFYYSIEKVLNSATSEDEIIANYFVIREDTLGLKFLSLLLQAALRGVRIKLIIDCYGSRLEAGNGTEYVSGPLSNDLLTTLRLNGIEIYIYRQITSASIFHPLNVVSWKNYSRRNHNKIFCFNLKKEKKIGIIIGDSQWALEHFNSEFIGHNLLVLNDEVYIQARQYNLNLINSDQCTLWIENNINSSSLSFWEARLNIHIKIEKFNLEGLKSFEVDNAKFVYPEIAFDCRDKRKTIQDIEIQILNRTKQRGIYCTPYFCPDRKLTKALYKFVLRGGKIFIGKYSHDPYLPYGVHQAVKTFFLRKLPIFVYNGYGNVHFKDLISDEYVFIKSANGEGRSRFYNLDSGIIIRDEKLADYFLKKQEEQIKKYVKITNMKHIKIHHHIFERTFKFFFRPLFYHHL